MKVLVIILAIYSIGVTGWYIYSFGDAQSEYTNIAEFCFGPDWRTLGVDQIANQWNKLHPEVHFKSNESLYGVERGIRDSLANHGMVL